MRNQKSGKVLAFAGVSLLLVLGTVRADAGLIVLAPAITGTVGSTGTFDIVFQNTGAASVPIGGFSFGISTSNPGITFTSATISTVAPYVFGVDSLFGPNIATSTGTSLVASDFPLSVPAVAVASGATVGLGDVTYSIAGAAATGLFTITLSPAVTSLSDGVGASIPIDTLTNGTLTVTAAAVPEPASLGLVGGPVLLAALVLKKKRSSRRAIPSTFPSTGSTPPPARFAPSNTADSRTG